MDSVVEAMGDVYPGLAREQARASKVLLFEEERFTRTLEQGMRILDEIMVKLKEASVKLIPGDELFKLYDTFGFPLDLARDIAMDNHLSVDEEGFQKEMEVQRERARASCVVEEEAIASIYSELVSEIGETEFVGYDSLESDSVVKAILKEGKVVNVASAGDEVEVFLDKTPFYGESGGQAGDVGLISSPGGVEAEVITTKKEVGLHAHAVRINSGTLKVWDMVHSSVDEKMRRATARNHTSTHLLHTALRTVLGEHVKQAGSYVAPERMRFDFTHFYALERKEIESIESIVNGKILDNIRVETEIADIHDALKSGVTALFGEKYGEKVRVVKVPGFSAELCGGTHCSTTGDIGSFIIVSEGSVASGIRRIEAFTGKAAFDYLRQRSDDLRDIAELLKTDKPFDRVEKLLSDLKDRDREIDALKAKAASHNSSAVMDKVQIINGVKVLSCRVDGLEQKDLRVFADNLRDRLGSGIIVLASGKNGQAAMLATVTRDLAGQFSAGDLLKNVAAQVGGKGGGKAEMAQGGVSNLESMDILDKALESVYDIVKKKGQG